MRKRKVLGYNDFHYLTGITLKQKQIDAINEYYGDYKARYWATIAYPESMCGMEFIKGYVTQSGFSIAISPLHDMDLKADHIITDGEGNFYEVEYKKAHYHVLMAFGNTTTYSTVLKHAHAIGCVNVTPVSSVVSYYRYLKHLDEDPDDKFIYNRPQDVIQHINGFDLAKYASEDKTYMMQCKIAIEDVIDTYIDAIPDLWSLINWLKHNSMWHELRVVQSDTRYFKEYIYGSKKHAKNRRAAEQDKESIMAEAVL